MDTSVQDKLHREWKKTLTFGKSLFRLWIMETVSFTSIEVLHFLFLHMILATHVLSQKAEKR